MTENRTILGFSIILALAGLGALLVYVPPLVVEQYKNVQELGGTTAVYIYFAIVGTGTAILLGTTIWILWSLIRTTLRKHQRRLARSRAPSQMSSGEREAEIQENLDLASQLPTDDAVKVELDPLIERITSKQAAQTLEIVAFGTISSGKSSLLNALAGRDIFSTDIKGGTTVRRNEIPWPGYDKVLLIDTPGLGEIDGAEHVAISAEAAKDADLILLVVDGPLRDDEFRLLEQLAAMEKRLVVCLNKSDWYDARSRELLLGQLAEQVGKFVTARDIVAVRSQPVVRTRVRIMADGSEVTEPVTVPPDIEPLAERMLTVLRRDGRDLLLANLLLQSRGMLEEARQKVKASLDRRAWQVVDMYTWGAGGAAALSPIPAIDIIAGLAISTKMVVDLAHIYGQKMDLKSASNLLGQVVKSLVPILGVQLATPAIVSAVASLLKTVPGVGTVAGGALQGCVHALVTRWIGAVFIEYFRNEMLLPEGGLASLARREWQRLTTVNELRKLVQTAKEQLWKS